MSGFGQIAAAGLGGLFDFFQSNATNRANREASDAFIAAQAANQERGLNALTGTSDFQDTTRSSGGGFDLTQVGGPAAAEARQIGAVGDIQRATKRADAAGNFDFNLPNIEAARGAVQSDINDTQLNFDRQANDVIEAQRRNFGGINNTNELPATLESLGDVSREFNFGKETRALDLLGKSNAADLSTLQNINSAFAPSNPAPSFTNQSSAGNTAANLIAQTPPPAPFVDLGAAGGFAAGGNALRGIFNAQQQQQQSQQFRDLINQIGNSNRGGGGGGTNSGQLGNQGGL